MAIVEVCGFNDWLLKMLTEYGCRETVLIQPEKRSKKKTDRRDAQRWASSCGSIVSGCWRANEVQGDSPHPAADRPRGRRPATDGGAATDGPAAHADDQQDQTSAAETQPRTTAAGQRAGHATDAEMAGDVAAGRRSTAWKWTCCWRSGSCGTSRLRGWSWRSKSVKPKNATAAVLATIPGCAAYGSLALASRIGSIERFPRPASLANYWGLTPGCRNSGEATDRLGSITKQGSAMARFVLGHMVLHVLRRDGRMKAWYGRIKRRRGSKIARVAVMRRLATIIWHMVKHNEPYVVGGPPRRKLAAQAA